MAESEYKVDLILQPTNSSCGYAALAILLSHYGEKLNAEKLIDTIPQPKSATGEPVGSVTAQLAAWVQRKGYKCKFYSFDFILLDLSWAKLNQKELLGKLKTFKDKSINPLLTKHWSKVYMESYIDLIESGAELIIEPFVTSMLINKLLEKGPIFANICSTATTGKGRTTNTGLRKSVIDENGNLTNHSIIIYGQNKQQDYLVADPWNGLVVMDRDQLVAGITAAIQEGDPQLFVIEKFGLEVGRKI